MKTHTIEISLAELQAALREYCGQDTLGMVEILRVLEQYAA